MKLSDEMPTHVLAKYKARGDSIHSALKHAYLMMEPTRNPSSYRRPGGILVFLQNNSNMLMQQPLYQDILKCTSIENQAVTAHKDAKQS